MSFGETIALLAVIAVVLIVLRIGAGLYKRRLELLERQLDLMAQAGAEKAAHHAALTESLEHRVRVLEQIATEQRRVVAEERSAPRRSAGGGLQ